MPNNTSQNILSTSANLLGFYFFVITSLNISNYAASMLDEMTAVIALLLILSCLFSFFSIRTINIKKENKLETIADDLLQP